VIVCTYLSIALWSIALIANIAVVEVLVYGNRTPPTCLPNTTLSSLMIERKVPSPAVLTRSTAHRRSLALRSLKSCSRHKCRCTPREQVRHLRIHHRGRWAPDEWCDGGQESWPLRWRKGVLGGIDVRRANERSRHTSSRRWTAVGWWWEPRSDRHCSSRSTSEFGCALRGTWHSLHRALFISLAHQLLKVSREVARLLESDSLGRTSIHYVFVPRYGKVDKVDV
jgi:hypothetical protein